MECIVSDDACIDMVNALHKRNIMKKILVLVVLVAGMAKAADLYVPSQYGTIAAAISAAVTGDTVWVADGTYIGAGNKDLTWSGKKITVRSVNGPNNCIIDCQNSGRGFYFDNAYDCGTISGFMIRNGNTDYGGGIRCYRSSPTIINCIISGNTASTSGGGIYCSWYSSSFIINCVISENSANYGGGIFCYTYSSPTITNCVISGNTATAYGGGIFCQSYSSPSITNNIISGNSNYGIYEYDGTSDPPTNYNCLYNNSLNAYYDEGSIPLNVGQVNSFPGNGNNISLDPKFIGGGDFHLQITSPCIDAGLNTAPAIPLTDKDGKPRIINGTVDMGAYEYPLGFTGPFLSSGYVGSVISFEGYVPISGQVSIDFGTHQTITTTMTNANGTFSATFLVSTQPGGTTIITLTAYSLQLTASFIILPNAILGQNRGRVGDPVSIPCTGLTANKIIRVDFGTQQTITSGNIGADGTFTAFFTVPCLPRGTYTMTIYGSIITQSFYISGSPKVSDPLSGQGPVGTIIYIGGTGYSAKGVVIWSAVACYRFKVA